MKLNITRTIKLPDPVKLARLKRVPELGPKILFFSGGTALKSACQELIEYTHNSIHIITPFDSGGSSAILRKAFDMPAIGDLRSRLLALADQSLLGHHEIYRLFTHRFPEDASHKKLMEVLDTMIRGKHPLVADIPDPMRKIIRQHLHLFREFMFDDFNLQKASIGNLILTAGYLENRRNSDVIIYIFSQLVQVRGIVRPVINKDLHLAAELENGTIKVGQHILTGKEEKPLESKIVKIWICRNLDDPEPVEIPIRNKITQLIHGADLICYPMGSFYSSLIANLLPKGVGKAISTVQVPKVYIPNTGNLDPETFGMTLMDQIHTLLHYIRKDGDNGMNKSVIDAGRQPTFGGYQHPCFQHQPDYDKKNSQSSVCDLLNYIIIDSKNGAYEGTIDIDVLNKMGIEVIDMPIVTPETFPYIDPKKLVPLLLSLL
ncbi:MAG: GAK system CofD-like protein [Desulfamplus sp.]|nr:GAK system CofD-like protein [Desulfamplus sp.]